MVELLLTIAADGTWFKVGDLPLVSIETRASLRRLMVALAAAKNYDGSIDVPTAFAAGWPGEQASPDAAATRVYTAIHTLRGMGLRGILIRRQRKYTLRATVRIAAPYSQHPPAMADVLAEEAAVEASENVRLIS